MSKKTDKNNKGISRKKPKMTKEDWALFHKLIEDHDKYYKEDSDDTDTAK